MRHLGLKPYWGKPDVRNFREGGGNVAKDGCLRRRLNDIASPVGTNRPISRLRATTLPDTGETRKSVEGERVAARFVVVKKRGNARGAKEPCCPWGLGQHGEAGANDKSVQ